jgi:hypothetical protein
VRRRINEKFLEAYLELDAVCSEKMNVKSGGVTEYINRLNNARILAGRDDSLPKLVRYRTIRNMLSHEPGAVRRDSGIEKSDIAWIKRFATSIKRKTDPLSLYLRRARRYLRFRKIRKIFTWVSIILLLLIIAVIGIYFLS